MSAQAPTSLNPRIDYMELTHRYNALYYHHLSGQKKDEKKESVQKKAISIAQETLSSSSQNAKNQSVAVQLVRLDAIHRKENSSLSSIQERQIGATIIEVYEEVCRYFMPKMLSDAFDRFEKIPQCPHYPPPIHVYGNDEFGIFEKYYFRPDDECIYKFADRIYIILKGGIVEFSQSDEYIKFPKIPCIRYYTVQRDPKAETNINIHNIQPLTNCLYRNQADLDYGAICKFAVVTLSIVNRAIAVLKRRQFPITATWFDALITPIRVIVLEYAREPFPPTLEEAEELYNTYDEEAVFDLGALA